MSESDKYAGGESDHQSDGEMSVQPMMTKIKTVLKSKSFLKNSNCSKPNSAVYTWDSVDLILMCYLNSKLLKQYSHLVSNFECTN